MFKAIVQGELLLFTCLIDFSITGWEGWRVSWEEAVVSMHAVTPGGSEGTLPICNISVGMWTCSQCINSHMRR